MYMPSVHFGKSSEHGPLHRRGFMKPSPLVIYFVLAESLLWAGCAVFFIFGINRIASGIKLQARLKALKAIPDAFTDEERELLVHKIKTRAIGPL